MTDETSRFRQTGVTSGHVSVPHGASMSVWRCPIAVAAIALVWLRWVRCRDGLLDDDARPSTIVFDRHGERLYEAQVRSGHAQRSAPRGHDACHAGDGDAGRRGRAVSSVTRASIRSPLSARPGATSAPAASSKADRRSRSRSRNCSLERQAGRHRRRGWRAKIREAVVALRLEHRLTKNEILALYLNLAPYGNQIEGAERAARAYFGRPSALAHPGRGGVSRGSAAAADDVQPVARARARASAPAPGARRDDDPGLAAARRVRAWRVQERLTLTRDRSSQAAPHFVERMPGGSVRSRFRAASTRRSTRRCSARCRASSRRAGPISTAPRGQRRGGGARQPHRRVAGVGRIGQLLRPADHGGAIDGVIDAAAAGLGAEAVHVRGGVRARDRIPGGCSRTCRRSSRPPKPGVLYSPRNYDGQFPRPAARPRRRSPDRRTFRRSRSRRRSAFRRWRDCCGARD